MRSRFFYIVFLILVSMYAGVAQDLSRHNWYFGNSTHAIRFDRTTNAAELITKNLPGTFGTGGSAVATDHTNRNLLFYTDGDNVYDVQGLVMPNGGGLGGSPSSNQGVVSCPVPGTDSLYYIFVRNAAGIVTRTTVNMEDFGWSLFPAPPTGDVIPAQKGVPMAGLTGRSEAMIIISQPLDTAYWLVTHEANTTNYTVTSINSNGVFTNQTFGGIGFDLTASSFSYHETTATIAVAPHDADMNILVLDFDDVNGLINSGQFLFNTSIASTTTQPATYDTEFSLNGRYLYLSRTGDTGIEALVLQYDFQNPTNTLDTVATTTLFRSWGLQMAPDSTIYHLYEETAGVFKVGQLADTDSVASATTYTPDVFGTLDFEATQFPSFAPKLRRTLSVSFTEQGLCSNATTIFFPTVTPAADSLVWDLGDGNFATAWSPVHTYATSGPMQVRVLAHLKGDTASFTKTINITQFDLTLTLVQDTTACKCELPINNPLTECGNDTSDDFSIDVEVQGGTPTDTQWYGPGGILTTQTTTTLRPDSAGYYFVVVTDATGCTAHAGVNIKEYGLQEQLANIWYFGNRAGIDFNDGAVPISNTVMDAPEGCAIVCDQNGQAIFFSDGNTVWNRDFEVLDTGIGGDLNSTQSVFIMPVSDDETLYYIFTTQEIYGTGAFELRYSLFDLKADNGLGGNGDIVQKAVPLFSNSTERITGNDNWLIAHEFGNNSFRAYRVTAQGISTPVISSVGSDHQVTIQQHGEGYMKLGSFNRIGVALHTPGISNVVEVFDFIDSTGVVSNFRTADCSTITGEVYGLEFSPGGNKLFATLNGAVSRLVEFSIDSLGNPYLKSTFPPVPNQLGAIQTAPDGQVYVAVEGQQFLGVIAPVEDTTLVSNFTLNGFALLGGTNSRLGLPNFAQDISTPAQQPSISVTGLCFGSPTFFTGTGTDNIDNLTWFFGDGASIAGDTASHTYAAPGDYIVSLQITNRCGLDTTITRTITIRPLPANPTFLPPGLTPVLCNGSLQLEATPATNPDLPNLSFLWTTGDTSRTLVVDRQQIIGVTITDDLGCSSDGIIFIVDNRPQVELGPDLTVCEDTPIAPLDAQNPGTTYAWTVNGGSPSATQTRSVDTTTPGAFEYKVVVSDPITLCTATDSITFTVNALPVFTLTPTNATGCAPTADGQIELDIPATGGSYSYFFTGPPPVQAVNQAGPINVSFTNLASGSYGVTVQDDLSGCSTATVIGITNPTITITATQNGTCDPLSITVDHNVVGVFSFQVLNSSAFPVAGGVISSDPFNTVNLPSGDTYIVEITQGSCTSSSLPVTLTPAASFVIDGFNTSCDPTTAARTISVQTTPAASQFTWSTLPAGGIIGSTTSATINLGAGTYDVTVTVDDGAGGLCPTTDTFNTVGADPFTASLTQTDPCEDQVFLNASPTGSFTYLWTRNPAPDPTGGQQLTLTVADGNATYDVTVRSTVSGCVSTDALTVNVVGEFSTVLTTTPPCAGTAFTLTATSTQVPDNIVWQLNGGVITGASSATLQDTREGEYEVTVTRDVCTDTDALTITVPPVTPTLMIDRDIICNDPANPDPETSTVLLDPGPGFQSFEWFFQGLTLNEFTPTYTATEPGLYAVELIDNFGCPYTDETLLELECDPKIVAPTAFRPSSANTLTKDFFVYTFFIADTGFQIFIFNRWGEMVYESKDPGFRWNGTLKNGALLPAGTYTYVVRYKSSFREEDGIQETRGGVMLVR